MDIKWVKEGYWLSSILLIVFGLIYIDQTLGFSDTNGYNETLLFTLFIGSLLAHMYSEYKLLSSNINRAVQWNFIVGLILIFTGFGAIAVLGSGELIGVNYTPFGSVLIGLYYLSSAKVALRYRSKKKVTDNFLKTNTGMTSDEIENKAKEEEGSLLRLYIAAYRESDSLKEWGEVINEKLDINDDKNK